MNKKLKLLLFAILILSLCIATVSLSACEENKLTVSYDSNHTVYEWDTLDSLKPYLTVTYKDKDGNINTVTDYVLSGTLAKGKCKVTVTYNDSTTWFICNVSAIEFTESLIFELNDDTDTYIVTGINGNETVIAIPPSYNGKPVTEIGTDAFYNTNITSVIIGNKVTNICDFAFSNCFYLTSVIIPNSVISLGDCVFSSCYSLTSVIIGNGVTTIGERAFYSCSNLTNVTIGNGVINIGEWGFATCDRIFKINYLGTIEDWCKINGLVNLMGEGSSNKTLVINGKEITGELAIPNTLTAIPSYAFCCCTNITNVTIPDSVTSIGNSAFIGCSSLTNVTIPDSATSIDDWGFAHCNNLTSVTIPDSVTSIGNLTFYDCSSLTNITIPDSVTNMGYSVFNGCSNLTNVTIGNSVTRIDKWLFHGCNSLTNVTIGNSVTSIDQQAFQGCINLTNINFNGTITQWKKIAKFSNWNDNVPATKVICTDGVVEL